MVTTRKQAAEADALADQAAPADSVATEPPAPPPEKTPAKEKPSGKSNAKTNKEEISKTASEGRSERSMAEEVESVSQGNRAKHITRKATTKNKQSDDSAAGDAPDDGSPDGVSPNDETRVEGVDPEQSSVKGISEGATNSRDTPIDKKRTAKSSAKKSTKAMKAKKAKRKKRRNAGKSRNAIKSNRGFGQDQATKNGPEGATSRQVSEDLRRISENDRSGRRLRSQTTEDNRQIVEDASNIDQPKRTTKGKTRAGKEGGRTLSSAIDKPGESSRAGAPKTTKGRKRKAETLDEPVSSSKGAEKQKGKDESPNAKAPAKDQDDDSDDGHTVARKRAKKGE